MASVSVESRDEKAKQMKTEIESAYAILKQLHDPSTIINNNDGLVQFAKIYIYSIKAHRKLDLVNSCFDHDFCPIICGLVEASYQELTNHFKNITAAQTPDNDDTKAYEICAMCVGIVRNFSNYSIKFIIEVHQCDVVKSLFKFLNDHRLVEMYADRSDIKARDIIRSAVGALVNLSKQFGSFSDKWKAENSVEKLLVLSERLKNKDDCQLACYMTLASIADDDEIEKLEGLRNNIF